jgi:hypothetical protein
MFGWFRNRRLSWAEQDIFAPKHQGDIPSWLMFASISYQCAVFIIYANGVRAFGFVEIFTTGVYMG